MTITAQALVSIIVIAVVFNVSLGAVAYCILLERKICAWVQDRIGPNRVGPMGLFQPLADGLKLFLKEDYNPGHVDKWLFLLAPCFVIVPALVGWAIVPWGGVWDFQGFIFWEWIPFIGGTEVVAGPVNVSAVSVSIGLVYVLAVGGVGVYGVTLGGWASNNKYSFLGGVRATAQMLSYEIPIGVILLVILLMAGTLRPDVIVQHQVETMWNIVAHPLAAVIYFTAILAEANRAPFDLAEAEQELIGGFHTEYASMKWALFFFAEYSHMITASAIFAVIFLGGWHVFPFVPQAEVSGLFGVLLKFAILAGKVALLIVFMMVVRWTLPRFRYDQLMNLAWKILIPISGLLLVGTTLMTWKGLDQWWWMLALNIAIFIAVWGIQPFVPKGDPTNRKLPLEGSRFSPAE